MSRRDAYIICVFSLFLGMCNSPLLSQKTILLEEDYSVDSFFHISPFIGFKSASNSKAVDLKSFCPTVGNQGSTGSCTTFAAAYGALTISYAIENSILDQHIIDRFAFSPSFIYNQLAKNDCSKPLRMTAVLDFMKEKGTCTHNELAFNMDCTIPIDSNLKNQAAKNRIDLAATITTSKMDTDSKVELIKNYLSDSIPVIGIIQVFESFLQCRGSKVWSYEDGFENYMGGNHAVTIIGYDDTSATFEIMNSWGKEWGSNGFVKIPYSDFGQICRNAMILDISDNVLELDVKSNISDGTLVDTIAKIYPKIVSKRKEKFLRNQFLLKKLYKKNNIVYERPVRAYLDNESKVYQVDGISLNDAMQFVSTNFVKDNYIYIFSQDPDNEITIHWPLRSEIDNKRIIKKTLFRNSLITLPGEERAIVKSKYGLERIFILSSSRELNIVNIIDDYKAKFSSRPIENLKELIAAGIVPVELVSYDVGRIEATSSSINDENYILPITIEIN